MRQLLALKKGVSIADIAKVKTTVPSGEIVITREDINVVQGFVFHYVHIKGENFTMDIELMDDEMNKYFDKEKEQEMHKCLTRKELFKKGFKLYQDRSPEVWTLNKDYRVREVYIYHKENNEHLKATNYSTQIEFLDKVSESIEIM